LVLTLQHTRQPMDFDSFQLRDLQRAAKAAGVVYSGLNKKALVTSLQQSDKQKKLRRVLAPTFCQKHQVAIGISLAALSILATGITWLVPIESLHDSQAIPPAADEEKSVPPQTIVQLEKLDTNPVASEPVAARTAQALALTSAASEELNPSTPKLFANVDAELTKQSEETCEAVIDFLRSFHQLDRDKRFDDLFKGTPRRWKGVLKTPPSKINENQWRLWVVYNSESSGGFDAIVDTDVSQLREGMAVEVTGFLTRAEVRDGAGDHLYLEQAEFQVISANEQSGDATPKPTTPDYPAVRQRRFIIEPDAQR